MSWAAARQVVLNECFVSRLAVIKLEWWAQCWSSSWSDCEEIPCLQRQRSPSKTVGAGAAKSLQPHGLQHARLPCPLLSHGVCSDSCPLSWWYYLTTSSSAALFSFCLLSSPVSGSSPMSQLFASGGQSIRALASASVLPMNIQDCFPLGLIGLISLLAKGLWVFSSTTTWNISSSVLSLLYSPTLTSVHDYWKNHSFD